ncbi:MAG: chromate resistance protein ChrB domain-containing protein [Acidobacteriota bacterium]
MKWITREKMKVDRIACPRLIKKFIGPDAKFVFLPADRHWASLREGMVYDVPACELGRRGEEMSFDGIVKKYPLADPAFGLLTHIARAADSHPTDLHPAGEGGSEPQFLDSPDQWAGGMENGEKPCRERERRTRRA